MITTYQLPNSIIANGLTTGNPWTDQNNLLLLDGAYANSVAGATSTSDVTIGNFNFSIPVGATIQGIEYQVTAYSDTPSSPPITLTVYAEDDTSGSALYYPDAPYTGFTPTPSTVLFGSPSFLFGTTWDYNQINNIKLNLVALGGLHIDAIIMRVYWTPAAVPVVPVVPLTCVEELQALPFSLSRELKVTDVGMYLSSFNYPHLDGETPNPITMAEAGPYIDLVVDKGQGDMENVRVDTVTPQLDGSVLLGFMGGLSGRGLPFFPPFISDAALIRAHGATASVIISDNAPFWDRFLKKCHIGVLVNQVISIYENSVFLMKNPGNINFHGDGQVVTNPSGTNVDILIHDHFVGLRSTDTTPNYLFNKLVAGANISFTILNPGANEQLLIAATGGGGGGHSIEVNAVAFPPESALNFINFFIGTDTPGVSTNINLDTAAIANDNTFITNLTSNSTFITAITNITGSGGSAKIDQTPDNGTYGTLAGAVNGINTTFTVSALAYVSGSLAVFLNGLIQWQGGADDWTETTPASGTFAFNIAPLTGDVITVIYQIPGVGNGSTSKVVTQTAHGFAADDIVRPSVANSTYVKSQSDTPAHAEVEGIVTLVIDANHFVLMTEGWYNMTALPGGAIAPDELWLSDSVAGAMTTTPPTLPPTVRKPIAQVIDGPLKLIHFHNYLGQNNQTVPLVASSFVQQIFATAQSANSTGNGSMSAVISGISPGGDFYGVQQISTLNNHVLIQKFTMDANTNTIYRSANTGFTLIGGSLSTGGICVTSTHVYFTATDFSTPKLARYDIGTLGGEVAMTIGAGGTGFGYVGGLFTDGTFLYSITAPGTVDKYSISGTNLTWVSTIAFTSIGYNNFWGVGYWCDGTNVYETVNTGGGITINKWSIAGGARTVISTYAGGGGTVGNLGYNPGTSLTWGLIGGGGNIFMYWFSPMQSTGVPPITAALIATPITYQ